MKIAGIGLFCTLGGTYKYLYSPFEGQNWLRQPVYSTSLIAIGIPVLFCALLPSAWIEKAAKKIAS